MLIFEQYIPSGRTEITVREVFSTARVTSA